MEQIGKEESGDSAQGLHSSPHLEGPEAEAALGLALVFSVSDRDDFDFAIGEALVFEAKFLGGTRGDVDDASGDKGTSVIDSHFEALAVFEVGDFDHARDGEGLVGGGDVPGHYLFAKGSVAPFETEHGGFVIPRGDSAFLVVERLVD